MIIISLGNSNIIHLHKLRLGNVVDASKPSFAQCILRKLPSATVTNWTRPERGIWPNSCNNSSKIFHCKRQQFKPTMQAITSLFSGLAGHPPTVNHGIRVLFDWLHLKCWQTPRSRFFFYERPLQKKLGRAVIFALAPLQFHRIM